MQIRRVEASYLTNVPIAPPPLLNEPSRISFLVIVEIETDNGIIGYGVTGGWLPSPVKEFINREVAPFLIGEDPLRTERVWNRMFWEFNQRALTGVWSSAMSAIDIALWDIKGKAWGQPVWRLLGGAQNPVPAYVTFGVSEYSREQLPEAARYWVALGHDKLKMVVGVVGNSQDPVEDAARVAAVREAVGPKVELMIDANYLMSFHHALRLSKLCEPLDLTWFEEPLYQNDARLLADLRRQTTVPLAAGQNEGHRWRHRELLVHHSVDILQPNVINVGGYTEAAKVAAMAQAFNIPIATGGGMHLHNMHLQAGMSNGSLVEFHYLAWAMYDAAFQPSLAPDKGWVTVPERPGVGFEPKPGLIKEYRVAD